MPISRFSILIALTFTAHNVRFAVENSVADLRVEGHPKQQTFQSYYGVPLIDANGKLLGTVCHFDRSPMHVTDAVATALDDLAPLITEMAFSEK